jgi:hypothetical protein
MNQYNRPQLRQPEQNKGRPPPSPRGGGGAHGVRRQLTLFLATLCTWFGMPSGISQGVYGKREAARLTRNRPWRRELTYAPFECFCTGIKLAYFMRCLSHGYVITRPYCHVPGSRVHTIPSLLLFLSVFNLPLFDNRGRWSNMTRKEELHRKVFLYQLLHNGF